MQLSAVALLIAMSLAMPDALGAGRGEGGDAAGQRPLGVALQSFSPAASNDGADVDRIRRLISPHIEGDVLVIEGKIDSHIRLSSVRSGEDRPGQTHRIELLGREQRMGA
jgi:hypothetical protein